ncbi:MAG: transporter [Bacteroidaceae bacterium]|nr:transporter [Bacteroidaceae bacterium]
MKKLLICSAFMAGSLTAMAGGLLTNTNQNAHFLRQMSQEGIIDINGIYANPAGTAFLSDGFHLNLNYVITQQSRDVTATFDAFKYGARNNGQTTKKFHGHAIAPIVPSFMFSYNKAKWSVMASFAFTGGGGKCQYDDGLGSFESQAALLPLLGQQMGITKYDIDSYMKGRSYYLGLTVGGTYKILPNLAASLGLRGIYATTHYEGYAKNIKINNPQNPTQMASPADLRDMCAAAAAQYGQMAIEATDLAQKQQYAQLAQSYKENTIKMGVLAVATQDITMECDQTGFGVAPIIGIDWKINDQWNVAARYDFRTRLSLKNKAINSQSAEAIEALGAYKDGLKVRADMPAILAAGAQYKPAEWVRINASGKYHFDKQAKAYGDAQKLLDHGTWELAAGAEFDFCKCWTVSASWQTTNYGVNDKYIKDTNIICSSNSIGLGLRVQVAPRCSLDFGYMQTFYQSYDKQTQDFNGVAATATKVLAGLATYGIDPATQPEAYQQAVQGAQAQVSALAAQGAFAGSEHFTRKNWVLGVGANINF